MEKGLEELFSMKVRGYKAKHRAPGRPSSEYAEVKDRDYSNSLHSLHFWSKKIAL